MTIKCQSIKCSIRTWVWYYENPKDNNYRYFCYSVWPCFRYGHVRELVSFVQMELKWPQDLLLLITLWGHEADDQLKILGQIPNQSCALRALHATVCHCFFTALFPFHSLHHAERQGSSHHTWTRIHMNTCKKHMHTRTHKRSTPYYSLLICRALIETPLSPSCTCIPSLIISQGAFGGKKRGGWWWKESPVTGQLYMHTSHWIKLSSQLVSASSSISGKKVCLEQNMWIRESTRVQSMQGLPLPSVSHPNIIWPQPRSGAWKCLDHVWNSEITFNFCYWHSNKHRFYKLQAGTVCAVLYLTSSSSPFYNAVKTPVSGVRSADRRHDHCFSILFYFLSGWAVFLFCMIILPDFSWFHMFKLII